MMNVLSANTAPEFPIGYSTFDRGGELFFQSLFDNGLPRDKAESQTVIQHGVASAGKQDGAAVGASNALVVDDGVMLQAGFIGDVLGRLRQFLVAQHCQQIAGKDDALAAFLDQALFSKEVGALLHGVSDFCSES